MLKYILFILIFIMLFGFWGTKPEGVFKKLKGLSQEIINIRTEMVQMQKDLSIVPEHRHEGMFGPVKKEVK